MPLYEMINKYLIEPRSIIAYEYLVVIATVGFILSLLQAEVKAGSQTHTA